jgi:uncharacterized protein (TIGR02757 family)
MNKKDTKPGLKTLLDRVLIKFPPATRIEADPIQFPRYFFNNDRPEAEIEAVALLSAMLAYGSAKQFIKKIRALMQGCGWQYLDLIIGKKNMQEWPAYRLSTANEIKIFCLASGDLIKKHKRLKAIFLKGYLTDRSIQQGLISLRQGLLKACEVYVSPIPRGIKHLLPDPASGGCAKRWHMFLRWMVRKNDAVDMNLWPEVSPADLLIPLDRHISKISRNLGLTSRKSDDWKTAEEITASLKKYDKNDPVKYDFSLCHLGIAGECTHGKNPELCKKCLLNQACAAFKKDT